LLVSARIVFIFLFVSWLGLLGWLALGPGGPDPAAKAASDSIRVITWNIHCGQDDGPLWEQFDWPVRKHALHAALDQADPDVLCVQEARPVQVAFLEQALRDHQRAGVGRDDGKSAGEHCAIFFRRQRFERLDGGTFWLEEPTDQPRAGSGLLAAFDVKRICTWVRVRDRVTNRTLRLYNTHLYLSEAPRVTAAKLILAHIAAGDPSDAVVLTADFNASPAEPSRRLFLDDGLADTAELAGERPGRPTIHMYGIGLWCIDGILVSQQWRVHNHLILNVKPQNSYPSDHFAILTDLGLSR
jgi:endonuclease/exonuclease/phosphatase family metal-dependent hydrolase